MMSKPTIPARRGGKRLEVERQIADHIKKNPDAVIARFEDGEMRIEKPVKELGPLALPKPSTKRS